MNYNNDNVRRQDRALPENEATNLLQYGEYGVLSMVSPDGAGYGVPLNFVWDGDRAIYFHSAMAGHKLDALQHNNRVSFCVVGKTQVISDKFTTDYESVIVRGNINSSLSDHDKMQALTLILDKYSPHDKEAGTRYAEKSISRTNIIRLDIESVSGKCKRSK